MNYKVKKNTFTVLLAYQIDGHLHLGYTIFLNHKKHIQSFMLTLTDCVIADLKILIASLSVITGTGKFWCSYYPPQNVQCLIKLPKFAKWVKCLYMIVRNLLREW